MAFTPPAGPACPETALSTSGKKFNFLAAQGLFGFDKASYGPGVVLVTTSPG
ncbi:hypothetical protein STXM2123_564 [Streptomyces sp. F-3]|nr:hypothetical protein STXM2123_564 [Streptomyces sp. F-3]